MPITSEPVSPEKTNQLLRFIFDLINFHGYTTNNASNKCVEFTGKSLFNFIKDEKHEKYSQEEHSPAQQKDDNEATLQCFQAALDIIDCSFDKILLISKNVKAYVEKHQLSEEYKEKFSKTRVSSVLNTLHNNTIVDVDELENKRENDNGSPTPKKKRIKLSLRKCDRESTLTNDSNETVPYLLREWQLADHNEVDDDILNRLLNEDIVVKDESLKCKFIKGEPIVYDDIRPVLADSDENASTIVANSPELQNDQELSSEEEIQESGSEESYVFDVKNYYDSIGKNEVEVFSSVRENSMGELIVEDSLASLEENISDPVNNNEEVTLNIKPEKSTPTGENTTCDNEKSKDAHLDNSSVNLEESKIILQDCEEDLLLMETDAEDNKDIDNYSVSSSESYVGIEELHHTNDAADASDQKVTFLKALRLQKIPVTEEGELVAVSKEVTVRDTRQTRRKAQEVDHIFEKLMNMSDVSPSISTSDDKVVNNEDFIENDTMSEISDLSDISDDIKKLIDLDTVAYDGDESDVSLTAIEDLCNVQEKDFHTEEWKHSAFKDCYVKLHRLPDTQVYEKLEENKRISENREPDVDRLCDLSTLSKRRRSSSSSEHHHRRKRLRLKKRNKTDEQSDIISLEVSSNSDTEDGLELPRETSSPAVCDIGAREALAEIVCNNIEDIKVVSMDEETEEQKKSKKVKGESKENKAVLTSEEKEKKKWKNDRLLHGKLISDSDSEAEIKKKPKNKKIRCSIEDSNKEEDSDGGNASKASSNSTKFSCSGSEESSSSADVTVNITKSKYELDSLSSTDEFSSDVEFSFTDMSSDDEFVSRHEKTPKKELFDPNVSSGSGKKGRKNIRAVIADENLAEATQLARQEEEERINRVEKKTTVLSQLSQSEELKEDTGIILDIDEESKKTLISVDPGLCQHMKVHQIEGLKFLWEACFESVDKFKSSAGSGCILAHCMGLGKTFQVIVLIHTLFTHKIMDIKHVLIVCPLSTVKNWQKEFKIWLQKAKRPKNFSVYALIDRKEDKLDIIKRWRAQSGVLIMGYEAYEILTNESKTLEKHPNSRKKIELALIDPGPELIVCDEGHLLKNGKTLRTQALMNIKTKRRIVLTGTPLQNNLKEYYYMVHFVKPNLLGTYKEYQNAFVNPIENGQYDDSSKKDIHMMKKRIHVLHKLLKKAIQRIEFKELRNHLDEILDYSLFIEMSPLQMELYKKYLELRETESTNFKSSFIQDYQQLSLLSAHPYLLFQRDIRSRKRVKQYDTLNVADPDKVNSAGVPPKWYVSLCPEDVKEKLEYGYKYVVVQSIIEEAESLGDKVLIFSASCTELDAIEHFLQSVGTASCPKWKKNLDYFRMDGTVLPTERMGMCEKFNDKYNSKGRVFIMSLRVGGLGLNLTAANRVILMGVNYNPSHDTQSIFRAYRFGQTKACYVYRLVAMGTMEEKQYQKCVTKLAQAGRVVDKYQIDRHYKRKDVSEFYQIRPEPQPERPTPVVPEDRVLANILQKHKMIYKYHEHNALLENKPEEALTESEKNSAWEEYNTALQLEIEAAKRAAMPNQSNGPILPGTYNLLNEQLSSLPNGLPVLGIQALNFASTSTNTLSKAQLYQYSQIYNANLKKQLQNFAISNTMNTTARTATESQMTQNKTAVVSRDLFGTTTNQGNRTIATTLSPAQVAALESKVSTHTSLYPHSFDDFVASIKNNLERSQAQNALNGKNIVPNTSVTETMPLGQVRAAYGNAVSSNSLNNGTNNLSSVKYTWKTTVPTSSGVSLNSPYTAASINSTVKPVTSSSVSLLKPMSTNDVVTMTLDTNSAAITTNAATDVQKTHAISQSCIPSVSTNIGIPAVSAAPSSSVGIKSIVTKLPNNIFEERTSSTCNFSNSTSVKLASVKVKNSKPSQPDNGSTKIISSAAQFSNKAIHNDHLYSIPEKNTLSMPFLVTDNKVQNKRQPVNISSTVVKSTTGAKSINTATNTAHIGGKCISTKGKKAARVAKNTSIGEKCVAIVAKNSIAEARSTPTLAKSTAIVSKSKIATPTTPVCASGNISSTISVTTSAVSSRPSTVQSTLATSNKTARFHNFVTNKQIYKPVYQCNQNSSNLRVELKANSNNNLATPRLNILPSTSKSSTERPQFYVREGSKTSQAATPVQPIDNNPVKQTTSLSQDLTDIVSSISKLSGVRVSKVSENSENHPQDPLKNTPVPNKQYNLPPSINLSILPKTTISRGRLNNSSQSLNDNQASKGPILIDDDIEIRCRGSPSTNSNKHTKDDVLFVSEESLNAHLSKVTNEGSSRDHHNNHSNIDIIDLD